jgi:hypothetical protein
MLGLPDRSRPLEPRLDAWRFHHGRSHLDKHHTYDDCDRATEPALAEANHDDAYRAAVSLFLAQTGGFVCWGQECRDESDFSP